MPATKLTLRHLLVVLCLLLTLAAMAAPKNVILMIGDGMGPDSITAAGAYKYGAAYHAFGGNKRLALETLANSAFATTYSSEGKGYDPTWAGGNKEYPKANSTDSAAAATALATGVKTYNAAIGVDPQKKPVTSILEIAKARGMMTGVLTSVPFSHATPAGFAAHNENRNNYTAITHDEIFTVQPDVIMGAGTPAGLPADKGFNYIAAADWQALTDGKTPYRLLQTREEFQALITKPTHEKIFGAFLAHDNMTARKADGKSANPAQPTLAEMTNGALATLANQKGFFLMVEGGAIDWCNHGNDLDGSIGEMLGFDEAVTAVLAWIGKHGGWKDNLLIITADHETGYLHDVKPAAAGTLPTVAWGSDGKGWGGHTNRPVPVFYQGAGSNAFAPFLKDAVDFERGKIRYIDNTNIFQVMRAALQPAPVPVGVAPVQRSPLVRIGAH